jgi:hypothetical protein
MSKSILTAGALALAITITRAGVVVAGQGSFPGDRGATLASASLPHRAGVGTTWHDDGGDGDDGDDGDDEGGEN